MDWYSKISNDLNQIPAFLAFYEDELLEARKEVKLTGGLEKSISSLPGIVEYRFNQLQEIEAVLNYLNIQLRALRQSYFKKYLEKNARALSAREADKYVDGEQEVIDYEVLINEVALIRNKWLGIMKGLENKQWMTGHVVKLRTAGMEDIVL